MKTLLLTLFLTFPTAVRATTNTVTGETPTDMQAILSSVTAQGGTAISFLCDKSGLCSLNWTEPKDGPVSFTDPAATKASLRAEFALIQAHQAAGVAVSSETARGFAIVSLLYGP